ncbi:MAG: hypothetical protein ACLPQ0_16450 [Candidatus Binatus sp.]
MYSRASRDAFESYAQAMRAPTRRARRYLDGTFMPESKKSEAYLAECERYAAGGYGRARFATRDERGRFLSNEQENTGLMKRASKPMALVRGRALVSLLLLLQALLLLTARDSYAGVIIWLEGDPVSVWGEKTQRRDHEIEIIQGHKEWIFSSEEQFEPISQATYAAVDDLDKGVRTNIYYGDKTYDVEKPPWATPYAGGHPYCVAVKPTGRFRKVAGYSCEEYKGTGESTLWGPMPEVDCVSHNAPGVREYNQFMSLLNRLFEDANYCGGSFTNDWPGFGSPPDIDGIPLETDPGGRQWDSWSRESSPERYQLANSKCPQASCDANPGNKTRAASRDQIGALAPRGAY